MNLVLPFMLEEGLFRGRFVKLDTLMSDVLAHHDYPDAVQEMVTEAVLAALLLSSALKFDGLFTMQIQGKGPLTLVVVDVTSEGRVRAHVQGDFDKIKNPKALADFFGKGVLVFTVDQATKEDERYQGVIELTGATLKESILDYFQKSEQIPTDILFFQKVQEGACLAAGVLVQQMPDKKAQAEKGGDFETISVLMDSVQKKEIFDENLSPEQVLFRLFHANMLTIFPKKEVAFGCRCSREKVKNMLSQFTAEQLSDMYEKDVMTVKCQFCGQAYDFKKEEVL